jgi:hypothetical protein
VVLCLCSEAAAEGPVLLKPVIKTHFGHRDRAVTAAQKKTQTLHVQVSTQVL